MSLLNSKRAQEAGTMTSIFVTFIILVIMVIFVALTGWLFVGKGGIDTGEFENAYKSTATENVINFLNSDAGEYGTIYDLLYTAENKGDDEGARRDLFIEKAKAYLSENFPESYDCSLTLSSLEQEGSINGYSAAYHYTDKSDPGAMPIIAQYSSSLIIVVPILPDKQLKLNLAKRKQWA